MRKYELELQSGEVKGRKACEHMQVRKTQILLRNGKLSNRNDDAGRGGD